MDLWPRQNMRTAWGKSRAKEGKGRLRGVNLPGVIGAIARGKETLWNWVSGRRGLGCPAGQDTTCHKRTADLLLRQDWRGPRHWWRVGNRRRRWGDARAVGCCRTGTGRCLDWRRQSNKEARVEARLKRCLKQTDRGVCFLGLFAGGVEGRGGVLVSL